MPMPAITRSAGMDGPPFVRTALIVLSPSSASSSVDSSRCTPCAACSAWKNSEDYRRDFETDVTAADDDDLVCVLEICADPGNVIDATKVVQAVLVAAGYLDVPGA